MILDGMARGCTPITGHDGMGGHDGRPAGPAYSEHIDDRDRRMWAIDIPAPAEMISVNGNPHWRKTSPARKAWRQAVYTHARAAKLPVGLRRVRIDVELRFTRGGRRDAANYHSHVAKPIVDGLGPAIDTIRGGKRLVAPGYGLIPDDTAEYLDGPFLRLGQTYKHGYGRAVITITELT